MQLSEKKAFLIYQDMLKSSSNKTHLNQSMVEFTLQKRQSTLNSKKWLNNVQKISSSNKLNRKKKKSLKSKLKKLNLKNNQLGKLSYHLVPLICMSSRLSM